MKNIAGRCARGCLSALFCSVLVIMTGCGGGGGSNSGGGDNFIGAWDISANLASNSCGLNVDNVFSPSYQINQNGNLIAAENLSSGFSLKGTTVTDGKGFVATAQVPAICPGSIATVSMFFANRDGDSAGFMVEIVDRCGSAECSYSYRGTARRV